MSNLIVVFPVAVHMFVSNERRQSIVLSTALFFPSGVVRSASPASFGVFIYVPVRRV